MPSEESIRTDASTVQRTDGLVPEAISTGSVEAEQIAQAKTVIRGSSRLDKSGGPRESLDRTPAAVAQVLLGERLNHFLLEELIGGGGMGAVFRAHDERLDRTVAIKVIPFVGDDPDLQRRFRNEAQSAAKLDHPRIARVFDAGSHGEWHYIVFEYIEGTNIRDLVASNGVLSIDDAVFYTSQLADALQHAADRGIVHRDIKPSNVLIGSAGKIKLVDMGLARSDNIDLSDDMTASGVTLGTFDYISPEQAHDPREADLRSDIYSLGCTLYFMLTGSPPYPGGTMLQKLLSHGNAPPPDACDLRPEVSDDLVAVIHKMLAKKPSERYQTATDLIADLREVAFRDGLTRSQELSPVTITQPNPLILWLETHTPWIVAAVLLVASAGWLHLESAASREDLVVPPTAKSPLFGPFPAAVDLNDSAANRLPSPAMVEPDAGPGTSTDETASRTFEPPENPPQLSGLPKPSELGSTSQQDADGGLAIVPDTLRDDPAFTARPPFLDSEEDAVGEPAGDMVPHVVRLVGSENQTGYDLASDGAALAPTLARALELAAKYRATRIEIAVPVVYSEPVRVDVDDLLITSTVGGSRIIFQPIDSIAMERSKMFSIGSHQIEFDDLHFVWNVPSGDIDGGTLFEINDNRLVRLTDCSITVSNPTLRDEVYAFDVITDPSQLPRERRETVDAFPLVWVELNNVVIRGQMAMLHMDYAAKLWLFWDNGLLAITKQMIDTAGARRQPAKAEPILLSLTRVTAHAPKGIVRMRVGVGGAHPIPIDRFARKSVFIVDPATPHFDVSGLTSTDDPPTLLQLRGASNAYVAQPSLADPMLRLTTTDDETEITRMSDLLAAAPSWADETSPRWAVNWAVVPIPDVPASQRETADYRQDDVSPPGFDEKSLPVVPGVETTRMEVSGVRSASRIPENRDEEL